MSETKIKRRAHKAVLDACPWCIYCGGDVPATTIDHVPPRIMFRGRHRPKGLDFPSCQSCNEGTKKADLVAAMVGHASPDAKTDQERQELEKILRAINNNIPGLLHEMYVGNVYVGNEGEDLARQRLSGHVDGSLLRANGPLVSSHMQTFSTPRSVI